MKTNYCLFVNVHSGRAEVVEYNSIDYLDYINNSEWKLHKEGLKKVLLEMADELNEMLID